MKYLIKQAGTEQTSYQFKGKHVIRTIESTQPFEGATQPDPEAKYFKSSTRVKDFAEQEAIKKRFKVNGMAKFKKAAGMNMKYFKKEATIQSATAKAMGKLRKGETAVSGALTAEKAGNNVTQGTMNNFVKNKMSVRAAEKELKDLTYKAKYMA